jgi:GT2 family glycosyltransferase
MNASSIDHLSEAVGRPTIAIVILNWNGLTYLEKFLPSVLASSYAAKQVIVADNSSTDESVRWLGENYPQIRLIVLDRNYGFAGGYNAALRQVESDYYVLLNSDVEVEPGWIEPILALMANDSSIGACQPKILMWADRGRFEDAGAAGGWIDHLGYPFAKGRVFDTCEKDVGQYDETEPIFWASGAAMFVRADIYHELGGLDGYFFAHQEEIDFCWRLQLAGYQVYTCPQSCVYHVGGGTLPKGNERKVFLNFRNNLIMMAKNLPAGQIAWKIPLRLILDSISAWKFLFSGLASYFWPVVKAHLGFYGWLLAGRKKSVFPTNRGRRGSGKPNGRGRDAGGKVNGWYPRSVAWQYFVSGKKTFREIMKDKGS